MQINVADTFPYPPPFFLVGGRAEGVQAPPVEQVGVLIIKQTVERDGSIPEQAQQAEILMTDDTEFDPLPDPPPDPPPSDEELLEIRFESDLAIYKPHLDIVVTRNIALRGTFGQIRIDRQNGLGFQPDLGFSLDYGWLSRVADHDPPDALEPNPRQPFAGDAENFEPDTNDKYKLPTGFQNGFFNGGRLRNIAHLQAGDVVEYGDVSRQVVIPAAPILELTLNQMLLNSEIPISLNVDTVIYEMMSDRFLITWRAVFPWSDRLNNATLEVS